MLLFTISYTSVVCIITEIGIYMISLMKRSTKMESSEDSSERSPEIFPTSESKSASDYHSVDNAQRLSLAHQLSESASHNKCTVASYIDHTETGQ